MLSSGKGGQAVLRGPLRLLCSLPRTVLDRSCNQTRGPLGSHRSTPRVGTARLQAVSEPQAPPCPRRGPWSLPSTQGPGMGSEPTGSFPRLPWEMCNHAEPRGEEKALIWKRRKCTGEALREALCPRHCLPLGCPAQHLNLALSRVCWLYQKRLKAHVAVTTPTPQGV